MTGDRPSSPHSPSIMRILDFCCNLEMTSTFKATLKGNQLEWLGDTPEPSDRPIQVEVTLLEDMDDSMSVMRRQKMVELLEKLDMSQSFKGIKPLQWQRDQQRDRNLAS